MCNMQVVKQDYNVKREKQETVVVLWTCAQFAAQWWSLLIKS